MGMSYRRTWLLVDNLNQLFVEPLVMTRPGGGGGAFLTETGKTVLALYRQIERDAAQAARSGISQMEALLAPAPNASKKPYLSDKMHGVATIAPEIYWS